MTKRRLLCHRHGRPALTLLLPTAHGCWASRWRCRPTPARPGRRGHRATIRPPACRWWSARQRRRRLDPRIRLAAGHRLRGELEYALQAAPGHASRPLPGRLRRRGLAGDGAARARRCASGDAARRRSGGAVQRLPNTFHGRALGPAGSGRLRCGHAAMKRLLSTLGLVLALAGCGGNSTETTITGGGLSGSPERAGDLARPAHRAQYHRGGGRHRPGLRLLMPARPTSPRHGHGLHARLDHRLRDDRPRLPRHRLDRPAPVPQRGGVR